jgi:nitrogen fixation/metabolism regulation signal transduction histidine kinase
MVSEAVELADIELRRHNVRLTHYVAPRLPRDGGPILIEQVLVNLLKNAAESIDAGPAADCATQCGAARGAQSCGRQAGVEFIGAGHGKGLRPKCMDRLFEAFSPPRPKAWALA